MVVHARRQAGFAVSQRGVGGHGEISPKRPSAGSSPGASRPSISGICMSISTASNGTLLQHLLKRPPARRRRGPPGRPRCSTARRRPGRFSALSSTTSRRTPRSLVRSTGRGGGLAEGALFAVQRMQHRVGQAPGVTGSEKIDEGRRAVVARIGQHLAAIGGDRDHHGRAAGRPATGGSVAPRRGRRDRGMRQSISTTSSDGPRPSPWTRATASLPLPTQSARQPRAPTVRSSSSPATRLSSATSSRSGSPAPGQAAAVGRGRRRGPGRTGYRCPARSRPAIPRSFSSNT